MLYGALLLMAIVFAAHAPRGERAAAITLAFALLGNWLLVGWTYEEVSPQTLFGFDPIDWWSIVDGMPGALAVTLTCRWWGKAIWALCCLRLTFHAASGYLSESAFTGALDFLLRAQIACFFLLGGKGAVQHVARIIGRAYRLWNVLHPRTSVRRAPAEIER